MAARSPQHPEAGWFTTPTQVNHRRYEALRAFFVGLTYQQAAGRFGYPRWAMVNLVREWRAGRLELFVPPRKPGPPAGVAPAKQRVRGRVIQLRRQGLSTYEISARLAAEQTPLNRTSVAEILVEEGFGRLLRGPAPAESSSPATAGRDTRLPRAAVLDLGAWPQRLDTTRAGLLLVLPDLVTWTWLAWSERPATPPPASSPPPPGCLPDWQSCPRSRRSPELLLPAGPRPPAQLPGRPGCPADLGGAGHRRAGDLRPGLPRGPALGPRPGAGTPRRAHPVPAGPLGADLLRPGLRHPQPRLHQRRPSQGHPGPRGHRLLRPLERRLRPQPTPAGHGPKAHHPQGPGRTGCPRYQVLDPADALTVPGPPHQQPSQHRLSDHDPGPARPPQQAQGPPGRRGPTVGLPRHRPPAHRHRAGPPGDHGHHHQPRPRQPQGPDRPVRPPHDPRTAPGRDHPRLLHRRPVQHRQPQRRPGRHARRPGPGPTGRPARPAARLPRRHPRHPAAPLPRNPRRTIINSGDTVTVRLQRRAYAPCCASQPPRPDHRPLVG